MNQNTLIIVAAAVVAVIFLLIVLRATRRQKPVRIETPAAAAPLQRTMERVPPATPAPVVTAEEGHGLADEAAAAATDVLGEILGIDAHHDRATDAAAPPGDELTVLKGLGPKAATQLRALGVTTYAQIAHWTDADITAIDTQMGPFKGRIARDQWVEQARLLATGDRGGFEAKYGKLG